MQTIILLTWVIYILGVHVGNNRILLWMLLTVIPKLGKRQILTSFRRMSRGNDSIWPEAILTKRNHIPSEVKCDTNISSHMDTDGGIILCTGLPTVDKGLHCLREVFELLGCQSHYPRNVLLLMYVHVVEQSQPC